MYQSKPCLLVNDLIYKNIYAILIKMAEFKHMTDRSKHNETLPVTRRNATDCTLNTKTQKTHIPHS